MLELIYKRTCNRCGNTSEHFHAQPGAIPVPDGWIVLNLPLPPGVELGKRPPLESQIDLCPTCIPVIRAVCNGHGIPPIQPHGANLQPKT